MPRMSKKKQPISSPMVAIAAILGIVSFSTNVAGFQLPENFKDYLVVEPHQFENAYLTSSLSEWISQECEGMAVEMDMIINFEAAESTKSFSLSTYLRYLKLYDQLSTLAKRQYGKKLDWVQGKLKAYNIAYQAANQLLLKYLTDLDQKLSAVEAKEKKGEQKKVGNDWVSLYESIVYISSNAPKSSILRGEAIEVMKKSPDGSDGKKRSTRYALFLMN